jgi:hypothetical protein
MVSVKDEFFEIDEIISMRKTSKDKFYLIKWKGYDISQSTWEPAGNLKRC